MLSKFYLIFLIFTFSCQMRNDLKYFNASTYLSLATSYKVTILRSKSVNSGEEIDKPVATWWPLVEFETIGPGAERNINYCLVYKIPNKGSGELKLIKSKDKGRCEKDLLLNSDLRLKDVKKLKIYLASDKAIRLKENKKVPPFNLGMIFKSGGRTHFLNFPLLNLTTESIQELGNYKVKKTTFNRNRFSNGLENKKVPGVVFWPSFKKNGKRAVQFLGTAIDSYNERTSIRCHQVNESCQTVGEYTCDRCRFGWYEVVPTKCPLTGEKFCGTEKCGQKGWPACYRGYAYQSSQIKFGCYKDNPSGYCREGLVAMCDSKGVLVCH